MPNSNLSALVCMSTFKGSLTNVEACDAVSSALEELGIPNEVFPMGDGGRGTIDAVQRVMGGKIVPFETVGPLGAPVTARLLCLPDEMAPSSVYIESADTCGYHLIKPENRDAMRASSQGLGKVIDHALKKWQHTINTIYIGLGDSAISDMGMGMLCALGFQFTDQSGHVLWGNANGLRQIRNIKLPDVSPLDRVRFVVLCDVLNPVLGPKGSARTFSRQKGASTTQISLIEQGMESFAKLIQEMNGRDLREAPMTGSAGGLGASFLAFFNTELVLGARFLLDWLHFDSKLEKRTFLVTGEGKSDFQTLNGKAPMVCLERADRLGKKSLLISGILGDGYTTLLNYGSLKGAFECGDKPSAKEALRKKTLELFSNKNWRTGLI